jgi:hypothetical protein
MYIWTAPGTGAAGFLWATGVSDDQHRAREAAETALRNGHAGTAYVERVYTAVVAPALSLCYVRTGTGWQAQLGQAGRVEWTPLTAPCESAPAGTPVVEAASAAAAAITTTTSERFRATRVICEDGDG